MVKSAKSATRLTLPTSVTCDLVDFCMRKGGHQPICNLFMKVLMSIYKLLLLLVIIWIGLVCMHVAMCVSINVREQS